MKSLYEITTEFTGESYVRSYCWVDCEEDAREFFSKAFPDIAIQSVKLLFSADADEFLTKPSDSGFETEDLMVIRDLSKLCRVNIADLLPPQ